MKKYLKAVFAFAYLIFSVMALGFAILSPFTKDWRIVIPTILFVVFFIPFNLMYGQKIMKGLYEQE